MVHGVPDLLLCNRFAELHTLLCVFQRILIRTLCNTKRLCSDTDTTAIQCGHCNLKALTKLTKQVFLRYLYIIENQLGC